MRKVEIDTADRMARTRSNAAPRQVTGIPHSESSGRRLTDRKIRAGVLEAIAHAPAHVGTLDRWRDKESHA